MTDFAVSKPNVADAKTVNPAVNSDLQYVLDLTVYFLEPQHYCKQ